jgi:hypothetical protein
MAQSALARTKINTEVTQPASAWPRKTGPSPKGPRVSGDARESVRQPDRPVIELEFGILVYPPEAERAVAGDLHREWAAQVPAGRDRGEARRKAGQGQGAAPFDLAEITTRVLQARYPRAQDLALSVAAELRSAPAAGDPGLAERLIANLIDNALSYNVPAGQVEVTTGARKGHAFLLVANTGPPVPAGQIQRLLQLSVPTRAP